MEKAEKRKIIVIAGTTESRQVIRKLKKDGASVIASVATELGKEMLKEEDIIVHVGRKDKNQFLAFFLEEKPDVVLDASHPFAKIVTETVEEACGQLSIPYERIERREEVYDYEKIIWAANAEEAAREADKIDGVILLTTGANTAATYANIVKNKKDRLYIRVLDTKKSIQLCEGAGISREHIIAEMPPFSLEDNVQLIKKINAAVLVSKDSGKQGGVQHKVNACKKQNIPMILIKRPEKEDNKESDKEIREKSEEK